MTRWRAATRAWWSSRWTRRTRRAAGAPGGSRSNRGTRWTWSCWPSSGGTGGGAAGCPTCTWARATRPPGGSSCWARRSRTWQTSRLLALESRRDAYTVYVRPELVVEIAFDGVQRSPRYPGGLALRFARVLRYREDKTAAAADTIDTIRALSPVP